MGEKKSLHEYFDLDSYEKLHNQFLINPHDFPDLLNLFNTMEQDMTMNRIRFKSPRSGTDIMETYHNVPKTGDTLIVKLNTDLQVIAYSTLSNAESVSDVIKESFDEYTNRLVIVSNEDLFVNDSKNKNQLEKSLTMCGIELVDTLFIDEKSKGFRRFDDSNYLYPLNEECLINMGKSTDKSFIWNKWYAKGYQNEFLKTDDFKGLKHDYVKQELQGLDVLEDTIEIHKLLKLDGMDSHNERLKTLSYDDNYKILDYEVVSVGGINSTIAEPRNLYKVVQNQDVKGFLLSHNHPSGSLLTIV